MLSRFYDDNQLNVNRFRGTSVEGIHVPVKPITFKHNDMSYLVTGTHDNILPSADIEKLLNNPWDPQKNILEYYTYLEHFGGYPSAEHEILMSLIRYLRRAKFHNYHVSQSFTYENMDELKEWANKNKNVLKRVYFDFDRVINLMEGLPSSRTPVREITPESLAYLAIGPYERLLKFRETLDNIISNNTEVYILTNNTGCKSEIYKQTLNVIYPPQFHGIICSYFTGESYENGDKRIALETIGFLPISYGGFTRRKTYPPEIFSLRANFEPTLINVTSSESTSNGVSISSESTSNKRKYDDISSESYNNVYIPSMSGSSSTSSSTASSTSSSTSSFDSFFLDPDIGTNQFGRKRMISKDEFIKLYMSFGNTKEKANKKYNLAKEKFNK